MALELSRAESALERDAFLRRLLHTAAFCLALATLLYYMEPGGKPYEIPLGYSLAIGISIWAIIDLSRFVLPLDPETGWPRGIAGILIVVVGIVGGFLIGTTVGDWFFGLSTWDMSRDADRRTSYIITVLAGVSGSLYFYFMGRTARQQSKLEAVQRTAAESKLKLLETQLEPHMLFNTLANLRVLISVDPERAQDMLDRLIAYLRATLNASRALTHPLADEFARLDDYLQLMAVRMGSRLAYTLDLPDEWRDTPVPPLLLQPVVENAIKHGLEPSVQGGSIHVRASGRRGPGATLRLDVTDTGVGLAARPGGAPGPEQLQYAGMTVGAPPPVPERGGFGLTQVRERLATAYGQQATIEVAAAEPAGTRVTLTIPAPDSPLYR